MNTVIEVVSCCSQVEVKQKKTAYAALVVHEENFDAQLKVK